MVRKYGDKAIYGFLRFGYLRLCCSYSGSMAWSRDLAKRTILAIGLSVVQEGTFNKLTVGVVWGLALWRW